MAKYSRPVKAGGAVAMIMLEALRRRLRQCALCLPLAALGPASVAAQGPAAPAAHPAADHEKEAAGSPAPAPRWKWDASIRLRGEAWNGVNMKAYGTESHPPAVPAGGADASRSLGRSDDRLVLVRTIAGFTLRLSSSLSAAAHLLDARTAGWSFSERRGTFFTDSSGAWVMNPNEEYLEFYDLCLQYRPRRLPGLTIKAGRQKIYYGDGRIFRIFGPGDWGNTGRWTWDALHFSYRRGAHFLDAWWGGTKTHDPRKFSLFRDHEFRGLGIYAHYQAARALALEPFFARRRGTSGQYRGAGATRGNPDQYWAGARVCGPASAPYIYDLTLVREWGRFVDVDVAAYAGAAATGWNFTRMPMSPRVIAGYTYASGEKAPPGLGGLADGTMSRFEPPFGANDYPYGRMNLMSWQNMRDMEIDLFVFPSPRLEIKAEFHRFRLAQPGDAWSFNGYRNRPGNRYSRVGDELDIVARCALGRAVELQFGGGRFLAGDFIRGNDIARNNASWLFLQVLYRFAYPGAADNAPRAKP